MNISFNIPRSATLKTRIILIFSVLTIGLVTLLSWIGYISVKKIYVNQLSDQTRLLVRLLAQQLDQKYLTYLNPEYPHNTASQFYHQLLMSQTKRMHLQNAFIFDDAHRVLSHSDSTTLLGVGDPRLELNRSEISRLMPGETALSLPFKAKDGKWYMWGFYRIDNDHWLGVQENAQRLAEVERLPKTFWLIGVLGVIITILAGWWLARTIARPVEQLVNFSRKLGQGEFTTPLPEGIRGELAILVDALDRMRRGLAEHHQEKEAMLAQIAHEIRNPLGGIELLAGLVKEDLLQQGGQTEYIDRILSEISGLKSLISAYLNYSRPAPAKPEWVPVSRAVEDTVSLFRDQFQKKQVELSIDTGEVRVWFDPHHLRQILTNLLANSLQAIDTGGTIRIAAARTRHSVQLLVNDTGPGIPAENLEKIFEPFFTTHVNGTGLGLAICKKLCQENNAAIRVDSPPGKGCTVIIETRKQDGKMSEGVIQKQTGEIQQVEAKV